MLGHGLGTGYAPNREFICAHSFGEEGEKRRGISSRARLRAGKEFPAGLADWQGCSHQRPPTTYLKLFLF